MTRINIINVEDLTDQHLIAEYREIFMIGPALQRSLNSKNWDPESIPKEYCLGKGHVKFFYNKGQYLHKRYLLLISEMKKRGMNPDSSRVFKFGVFTKNNLYKNWKSKEKDELIIKKRIKERINQKPDWYRKTSY
jgi:deoxyribonuclease (pyrimidine dimer)